MIVSSTEELKEFLLRMNSLHQTNKFIAEVKTDAVDFVDVTLYKGC